MILGGWGQKVEVFPWQHPQTQNGPTLLHHFFHFTPHLIPLPSQARLYSFVFRLSLVSLLVQCGPFLVTSSSGGDWIHTHPDLPKLPIPKALDELQRLPWDLPHIFRFDGQVSEAGHPFVAGNHQATAEPGGSVCTQRCTNNTERA